MRGPRRASPSGMPRRPTKGSGGLVFHVMNRAARGATLFGSPHDYVMFLEVLSEACARRPMRLCAFTGMRTHWHMVLWPAGDDDLARFVHWFSVTQVRRWHAAHG